MVKLVVDDLVLNIISVYAPQLGHDESAKRLFWEDLDGMVRAIPISEKLFIGRDLNGGHVQQVQISRRFMKVLGMVVGIRRERKSWDQVILITRELSR